MLFALTVLAVSFFAPTSHGQQLPADSQDAEVLTRGPIHDAFAMPVGLDPVPGAVVPRQPPADIEELPPEVAVEDPNAEWIAGYWNWDDEREDFIWISGVWRVAPPEHRWVAGYWTEVQGGFQRISGFWAPTQVRQVVYYPQPPQSLEAGPNSPQPSPNHFWVPGNWVFADGRYAWRGGYWAASQQNWIWIPAYYVNTPGGYIYNAGYWDYPLDDRGMMFAPVYFRQTVYSRPNFYYSPSVVIRAASLLVHLFARPSYGSYYFGDYYGPAYANAGYRPWFSGGAGPRGNQRWYDPIYTYQRSQHGRDPNWNRHLQERYDFYATNQDARPRRTYEDQRRYMAQNPNQSRDEIRNTILATSVADIVTNVNNVTNTTDNSVVRNVTNVKIRQVQNDERKTIQKQALDVKQFAKQQRSQIEKQGRVASANGTAPTNDDPRARGPRPGAQVGAGANVAAGTPAPSLTLPELTPAEKARPVRTPGSVAGPNATGPNNAGPNNVAGPSDRPNRGQRPERPDRNLPQRPAGVAGPGNGSSFGVNPGPNADAPRTGRPAEMPQGRRTGSAVPGTETPENPVLPPASTPGAGPRPGRGPVPMPSGTLNPLPKPSGTATPSGTPGVPRLPQAPRNPETGESPRLPRGPMPGNPTGPNGPNAPGRGNPNQPGATPLPSPSLPQPSATKPKARIQEQPRTFDRPGNPDKSRGGDQPRSSQPRNVPPQNLDQPVKPMPKPEMRQRPIQTELPPQTQRPPKERPQQSERPQQRQKPKDEPKPQPVPKVNIPVAPQTPPNADPTATTKPDKKKKKD